MQLVSTGAQDIYLTGKPEITFFKTIYRRYTNFAIELMEQSLSGNISFNNSASSIISMKGDLMTKMYLKITVTGTSGSTGKWAFCKKLGNTLIKDISFLINGLIIDKQYGEWFNIWDNFFRNPEHDRGYNILIGNTTEATTLSSTDKSVLLYIPLKFFFNRHNGLAIPLIALQYSSIRIDIKFNESKYCYIKENQYFSEGIATDFNVSLSLSDHKLLINYIFLDSEERSRFAKYSHEYLIEQVQSSGDQSIVSSLLPVTNTYDYYIQLNHPTKAIYWVIKNKNFTNGTAKFLGINGLEEATKRLVLAYTDFSGAITKGSYLTAVANVSAELQTIIEDTYATVDIANEAAITLSNGFTSISCNTLLTNIQVSDINWVTTLGGTGTRNTGITNPGHVVFDVVIQQPDNFSLYTNYTGQPMVSTELKLNGHNRFSSQNANYFTYVQSYETGKCSPKDGLYMYSFALNPDDHQPSGTCNFSKLDTAVLNLVLNNSITDSIISLYAVNYNVLKIEGGRGFITYKS